MVRKSIAPWAERVAEGLIDQPIDSSITATQTLTATVDTGFIDQSGTWKGVVSSDSIFSSIQTDIGIANGVAILTPSKNADGTWPLDMTGYTDLMLAINVSNTGNYKIGAVMGPDTVAFGGLSPVEPAVLLKGFPIGDDPTDMSALMDDAAENISTAGTWFIFSIMSRMKHQKLLQFKITNNSGGSSDIQTAFMRLV